MKKTISLLLVSSSILFASNIIEKANKAYDTKNYKVAYNLYIAEKNNPIAEYELATMYQDGKGIEQNLNKAEQLYLKAAAKGHTLSQVELGILYMTGEGVKQNYKKAFQLFQEASKTGNDFANYNLARMYWNGYGVQQNYALAYKHYKVASDQGHMGATYALASMLEEGQGCKKDLKEAYVLYEKSAKYISWSSYALAIAYLEGNKVITKNTSKGMNYLVQSVKQGDVVAITHLAKIYYHGLYGQESNAMKAMALYEKATQIYQAVEFSDTDLWHETVSLLNH